MLLSDGAPFVKMAAVVREEGGSLVTLSDSEVSHETAQSHVTCLERATAGGGVELKSDLLSLMFSTHSLVFCLNKFPLHGLMSVPVYRSYVETLSTAAFDSIKEFDASPALPHTPFVTNSRPDHDDGKLTVWPGRHGGPSVGAFLSHG